MTVVQERAVHVRRDSYSGPRRVFGTPPETGPASTHRPRTWDSLDVARVCWARRVPRHTIVDADVARVGWARRAPRHQRPLEFASADFPRCDFRPRRLSATSGESFLRSSPENVRWKPRKTAQKCPGMQAGL